MQRVGLTVKNACVSRMSMHLKKALLELSYVATVAMVTM